MGEDNSEGLRGYIMGVTTAAAAIFNLAAILLICFILIPHTVRVSDTMEQMREDIAAHNATMQRLNAAMDANEARMKAAKKDGK